jgi:hypothetical protein
MNLDRRRMCKPVICDNMQYRTRTTIRRWTADCVGTTVFIREDFIVWKIRPCSPLKVDRRYRGEGATSKQSLACCLLHGDFLLVSVVDSEGGCSVCLRNVDWLSKSKSELLYDCRFTANQFVLASSPLRPTARNFFQLNFCGNSSYVTFSLMRRWVCPLWICFAFRQVYISHI